MTTPAKPLSAKPLTERIENWTALLLCPFACTITQAIFRTWIPSWGAVVISVGFGAVTIVLARRAGEHCRRHGSMFSGWHIALDVLLAAGLVTGFVIRSEGARTFSLSALVLWLFCTWILSRLATDENEYRLAKKERAELLAKGHDLARNSHPELEHEIWAKMRNIYANTLKDPLAAYACERVIEKLPPEPPRSR